MKNLIIVILGFIGVVAMPKLIALLGCDPAVGIVISLIIMVFMFLKEVE